MKKYDIRALSVQYNRNTRLGHASAAAFVANFTAKQLIFDLPIIRATLLAIECK